MKSTQRNFDKHFLIQAELNPSLVLYDIYHKVPKEYFSHSEDKAKTSRFPLLNCSTKPTSISVLFHFWHLCEYLSSKARPEYFIGVKKQTFQLMVISMQDEPSLPLFKPLWYLHLLKKFGELYYRNVNLQNSKGQIESRRQILIQLKEALSKNVNYP